MPKLGESVVEGTVARWLKKPGDSVAKLEPLLEISTDKIDTELPAPASGTLLAIAVAEGSTVAAGTVLATIGDAGEAVQPVAETKAAPAPAAAETAQATPARAQDPRSAEERPAGRNFVSPVVKRIAEEHQVDLAEVSGSGLGGRVTKQDVLAFVEKRAAEPALAAAPSVAAPVREDEILHPLSAMRRAIAAHMVQSKATSPHVTTFFEVDMTAVVRHREAHKSAYGERGVKLSLTPYFVAAVAAALRAVPAVNSRWAESGIAESRRVHVGVAVAVEKGLLVPVVRDADELNLAGVARAVADLAERARSGALLPDELQGGTFTITNHGVGGSILGTPIINQPQAAILGVGSVVKRPVVRPAGDSLLPSADDAIVIRPICYLSLSFDHRILDGALADRFMAQIKRTLEEWQ